MITLTARINLISSGGATLTNGSSIPSKNNISSEIGAILGVKSQGSNPFILGASKLGDGSTLSGNVDYFIGSQLSDENGLFSPYCEIKFTSSKSIRAITILFDTVNNRFPKSITVDNVVYSDDDPYYTVAQETIINLSESAEEHTILIDNWNTPNYPLVIQGIYVDIDIDVNYRNLISLNRNITYRSDNKLPSYGIISNTGNLEFNDLDGEIRDYAEQLLLTSDLKVTINLNNSLTGKSEQVGIFETETCDYDNDNRSVSVSLRDDLEEWQDIQIEGFDYDFENPKAVLANSTIKELYEWLFKKTPDKYKMQSFSELDRHTQQIIENTTLTYALLEGGTLWEQWTKLCEVCGLYIYKNNEGRTICIYTYGS